MSGPCGKCGRTLLDLRRDASSAALKGAASLCRIPACPLVRDLLGFASKETVPRATDTLSGPSPPAVFVGRHGYPNVAMGPLLPAEAHLDPRLTQAHGDWASTLTIEEVVGLRSSLYRSKAPARVDARDVDRALDTSRQLALSRRPVETQVGLAKPFVPRRDARIDGTAAPMGPSIDITDAQVLSHPSVPRRVDALVSDVHADASTAMGELAGAGIGEEHIQRLLSVGLLGLEARRRLVPTRWAITATDDTLGRQIMQIARDAPLTDAPRLHRASLFGNHFFVALLPRVWAFDMVEAFEDRAGWRFIADREPPAGRTSYASNVAGGYYAARLAVFEHLQATRRQAAAFVYREITEDYWAPLGVWVVREAMRTAMAAKPLVFDDIAALTQHIGRFSRTREWVPHARLLRDAREQRTLADFG